MCCEDTPAVTDMEFTDYITYHSLCCATENIMELSSNTWLVLTSETAITMYISSLIITVVFIVSGVCLKHLVEWRMKQSPPYTPNRIVFAGQVFLAMGLIFSAASAKYLPFNVGYSFQLYSVSSFMLVASMFLSYDCRRPPSFTVGYWMCLVGVLTVYASLYWMYTSTLSVYSCVCFILGFDEFAIGSAFITMNYVKEHYVCFQPAGGISFTGKRMA